MSLAYKVSKYNRKRKWKIFLREFRPEPGMRVLDVGYSDSEYSETDNFIEKHYPYPEMLTALGLDKPHRFREMYPHVDCVQYDGIRFPFDDQSFDVCWSNAVIEHVAQGEQLNFIREIDRVAKRAFITTPNRYFPIEVHTRTPLLHMLPKPVFEGYLRLIGKGWATGSYMHLLSLSELKSLLKKAHITEFEIVKNKIFGFSLDFVVILNSTHASRM